MTKGKTSRLSPNRSAKGGAAPSGRAAVRDLAKAAKPAQKKQAAPAHCEISIPGQDPAGPAVIGARMFAKLLKAARKAQASAHAPYSQFPVGAALLTDKGEIYAGCNVENASYPLTVCAERNAIGCWAAGGKKGKVTVCLVVGPVDKPLPPCGACRQVLAEFNVEMTVICCASGGDSVAYPLSELLPHRFSL